jgi:hypothetical protein
MVPLCVVDAVEREVEMSDPNGAEAARPYRGRENE